MRRLLPAFLTIALLAGCSVTYLPAKSPPPAVAAPTLPPSAAASRGEAAGNVACPKTVGSAAGYTLFGAPAPDFNAGHQGTSPLTRCATDGKVIVLQLDIAAPAAEAQALAIARRQLPNDLVPVYDRRETDCRDIQLKSRTLAAMLGSDDPDGVVNIELESLLATDFKFDPAHVDTIVIHQQYELSQTRPCVRS